MFEGFELHVIDTGDARVHVRVGGAGGGDTSKRDAATPNKKPLDGGGTTRTETNKSARVSRQPPCA